MDRYFNRQCIRHGKQGHPVARRRLATAGLRFLTAIFLLSMAAGSALGQAAPPSRTACKGWDNAFLTTFHTAFVLVLAGTCVLGLITPLLIGRFFWWVTASRARILWITIAVLSLSVLGVIVYPRVAGLGNFGYSGINSKYLECAGTQFGAAGLFGGLLGRDVAAISQWPAMLMLLCAAALVGGLLAFFVSEALVKSIGITSKVSGGAQ